MSDSDNFYSTQQDSVYYYANTVPMWNQVKNGNWKLVENLVRQIAIDKKVKLSVWTGSIGSLTLPNMRNKLVEIFLYPADTNW